MEKEHGLSSFPNSLYHILPQVLSMYRNNPFSIYLFVHTFHLLKYGRIFQCVEMY